MTTHSIGALLGILAGVVQAVAYLDYNYKVVRGGLIPNGSTWLIWTLLAVLTATTYGLTVDDWAKTLLSVVNTILCIATFAIAFFAKKFDRVDFWDKVALVVGLSSVFVWYFYQSAMYANFVLQVSIAIGFVPTYRMVWSHPHKERIRPWLIWTSAYLLLIIAVGLRWSGQWQDIVYPVNCLILHPLVAILIVVRSRVCTV